MASIKIICDTDIMIDYLDSNQPRHVKTRSVVENVIGIDNIILSAVTKFELIAGAFSKDELKKITSKLNRFDIALINEEITLKAFDLVLKYKLSHSLAMPDCLIASTSLVNKIPLFTYNKKDFKFINGLTLF